MRGEKRLRLRREALKRIVMQESDLTVGALRPMGAMLGIIVDNAMKAVADVTGEGKKFKSKTAIALSDDGGLMVNINEMIV